MIEFKKGRYITGIWFIAYKDKDVVVCMYTDDTVIDKTTLVQWHLDYRFRYYDPADPMNDPWSGKDRKSRYHAKSDGLKSEEEMLRETHHAIDIIFKHSGGEQKFFAPMFSADAKICIDVMSKQPWAHVKQMSKEEYEKEYDEKGNKKNATS